MTSWRRREHERDSKLEKLLPTLKGGKNKLYPPHLTEESPSTNIAFPELRSKTATETAPERNKRTMAAARRSELISNLLEGIFLKSRFDEGRRGIYKKETQESVNYFYGELLEI